MSMAIIPENPCGIEMTFIIEKKGVGDTKAIDNKRGIVFDTVPYAAPEDIRQRFSLDWHGQKIYFEGREVGTNRFQDEHGAWKFDLDWKISAIMIPDGFPESRESVFQVICEALNIYGMAFSRNRVNSVKAEHSKNAFDTKIDLEKLKFWWDEEEDML